MRIILKHSKGSIQFNRSAVSECLRPHGLQHARPPCPSPAPRVYWNSCPLSWWCHPIISSSVIPFSCLQSFPASGSFQISQFFTSGSQRIGVSASASVLPVNIQDFIFGGSKITADGDCSHEIKICLILGRKVMTNLERILKSRDITLPTKVRLVKAMVFQAVRYGCECLTLKKANRRKTDVFKSWCWRRLLRVPWTARKSNQSILKEISSEY